MLKDIQKKEYIIYILFLVIILFLYCRTYVLSGIVKELNESIETNTEDINSLSKEVLKNREDIDAYYDSFSEDIEELFENE